MSYPHRVLFVALLVVLSEATPTVGQEHSSETATRSNDVIQANGGWGASREEITRSGAQRWGIDALRYEDGQLRGRIGISGSPLLDSANVEGRLSGRGVVGTLVDDEGRELAEFQGAMTASGASGTYRDRNGESGEWQWEGRIGGAGR